MGSETIKEFVVDLSWKVKEDEQRRFLETIDKAQKGVMAFAAAFGALEIAQKFERTASTLNSVYYAATRAGTSFGKLLDLQNAFTLAGGTKEQATELVASVERKFSMNMAGMSAAFQRWTGKSATDANGKLRATIDLIKEFHAGLERHKELTPSSRIRIEEETFGANRDAMRVFIEAQKLMREMAGGRNIWGIDEKTAEHARQFDQAMQRLKITFENIWEGEASKLFERWGERLKELDDFLKAHAEGIKTAVDLITEPLIALSTVLLLRVVPGLNGMVAALGTLSRFVLPGWLLSMLGVTGLAAGALGATVMPQSAGAPSDLDSLGQAQERTRFERDHPILSAPGRFWRKHAPSLLGGSKNEHLRRGHVAAGGGSGATATPPASGGGNSVYAMIDTAAAGDKRVADAMKAIFEGESNHTRGVYDANTRGEASYGPFQLNKHGGLGAQFQRETGFDPANPSTVQAQANWVADYIRRGRGSLSAWRGYQHGVERIQRGQTHPHDTPMNLPSTVNAAPASAPASHPWQNFVLPNFTLPPGHSAADPFGFHADMVRRAQHQGAWSNSITNHNNVNMGGQKTTINIDGAGMDPHAMADMIGRKQVRVHADFLRNAKSAIA